MTRYQQGTRVEYDVKFMLERDPDPWLVIRSAGSHGVVDLIAMWRNQDLMIQCKKGSKLFSKKREAELIEKCKGLTQKIPCIAWKETCKGEGIKPFVALKLMNLYNKEIIYLWPLKGVRGLQENEREEKKAAKSGN